MKCLVSGGAGFIGSHLVEALLKKGAHVFVLDNLETGAKDNLQGLSGSLDFIEGDICHFDTCLKYTRSIDYVFHLAALGSVPRSIKDPIKTNYVNVNGTLHLLQSSVQNQVKRFIFASSSSVYGDTEVLPKHEEMCPQPMSPYALSKYTAEKYVSLFSQHYNIDTVSLRYFNVFGPRQSPDSQYAAVIPRFIKAYTELQSPQINGDGEQTRDFTSVIDVVNANLLAANASNDLNGEYLNIAYEQKTSINELAKIIKEELIALGSRIEPIQPVHIEKRAGDVRDSMADYSKASRLIAYQPQMSLRKALQETCKSFLK